MLTIENISNDHLTLNASPAAPITLAAKGSQHIFKDEKSYSVYQLAVSALLQSGKLVLKKGTANKSIEKLPQPDPPVSHKSAEDPSEQKEQKKPIKKSGNV